ncbi:hypothetical protein NA57DRAFT_70110 [Rhizodiscina lignyota]|uniref:Uncharacterized protein n=1 Tax=Rhizodiscina lignyota TaxID=1504668 RepID=A0A9P4MB26_9PEZI|nr:hypothetical protein NA57DRAFT_70110 [Rhizodiscina lignyota]
MNTLTGMPMGTTFADTSNTFAPSAPSIPSGPPPSYREARRDHRSSHFREANLTPPVKRPSICHHMGETRGLISRIPDPVNSPIPTSIHVDPDVQADCILDSLHITSTPKSRQVMRRATATLNWDSRFAGLRAGSPTILEHEAREGSIIAACTGIHTGGV